MSDLSLTALLSPNVDNEKKYIAYLFDNPSKVRKVKETGFQDINCKLLFKAIKIVTESNLKVEKDIVLETVRKSNRDFSKNNIELIRNEYTDFENIKVVEDSINDRSITLELLKDVDGLTETLLQKQALDKKAIQDIATKMSNKAFMLGASSTLLDGAELMDEYQHTLNDRIGGISIRSLAYQILDENLTRPAGEGEMTFIYGQKGSGKSILVKNIENKLVNQGTCVVSINLEMGTFQTIDRLFSIRHSIPIKDLLNPHEPEILTKIESAMKKFRKLKNYAYYPEPSLGLEGLDNIIYEAKQKFRNSKVLPDDGYIVVVIDLLTMLKEFSGATVQEGEHVMNVLNELVKKHNIHLIGVGQANENKMRNGKIIKNPDDLDFFKIGLEDIKSHSAISERCRVVISLARPLLMKQRYFPELADELAFEVDTLNLHVVKQNDGPLSFSKFILAPNMRIFEYVEE